MADLFPVIVQDDDIPNIPGLVYRPDYISEVEETRLATAIDREAWDTSWERRRQLYGASYGAPADPKRPIPEWARDLIIRFQQEDICDRPFDQLLVNEYLPGQGIALHRDYDSFDRTVVSLSLLSACIMDFRRPPATQRVPLLLQRRSLIILSDEARYDWQHGIARRRNDIWHGMKIPRARRLSVTFRLRKRDTSTSLPAAGRIANQDSY
jgi:alkylated DNA repair dioxygenase AlkB